MLHQPHAFLPHLVLQAQQGRAQLCRQIVNMVIRLACGPAAPFARHAPLEPTSGQRLAVRKRLLKRATQHGSGLLSGTSVSSRRCSQPWRPPAILPHLTRLAADRVRPTTQRMYLAALQRLCAWLFVRCLPLWTAELWDDTLVEFLEHLYDINAGYSVGARLPPALLWGVPQLAGTMRSAFPSAMKTLKGWERREPIMSRPPLPWEAVAGSPPTSSSTAFAWRPWQSSSCSKPICGRPSC